VGKLTAPSRPDDDASYERDDSRSRQGCALRDDTVGLRPAGWHRRLRPAGWHRRLRPAGWHGGASAGWHAAERV